MTKTQTYKWWSVYRSCRQRLAIQVRYNISNDHEQIWAGKLKKESLYLKSAISGQENKQETESVPHFPGSLLVPECGKL